MGLPQFAERAAPHAVLVGVVALIASVTSAVSSSELEPTTGDIPIRIVVTDASGRGVRGLSAADVEIYESGRPQTLQTFAAVKSGPRTFGLLLDDYHVSESAAARVVTPLLEFIDQHVRTDDIVFIMRPLDPASSLAPVRDRDQLRAMIAKFAGRKGNYAAQNAFEAEYLSAAPPTAARQRAQIVRAAMQALATAMSRPGPDGERRPESRAMAVVTEGFAPDDRGRERLATLRTVARAARSGNVAVYVLDPSEAGSAPSGFGEQWELLATQTGGLLATNTLSLAPVFAQVSSDLDASYLLTLPRPEKEDGGFHRLDIRVKRRNVAVRAPSGYWAPIAAERLTPATRPSMSTYLKTPHITGLIQPWFRMTKAAPGRTRVTFSWVAKPRSRGTSVAFSAITFEGARVGEGEVKAQAVGAGPSRAVFDAEPGPIQISMAVSDANGKLLDTEVRYIDVPSLETPGALIAAVDVVRARTLREFLALQLNADVLPAETREFYRDDRLIVRVHAFANDRDAPVVRVRLLNPRGHPIRDLAALPAVDGIPQFDLPLANYARGDYRIEVSATSGVSTTSQLVMFRLVG